MKTGHNCINLANGIIALSNSNTWESAKYEWVLQEVYEDEEPKECLCGHKPIKEICILRNQFTGEKAIVGNVCVKKFLGLPSGRIFTAFKRITKDNSKSLNFVSIEFMNERGWLTSWEYQFYCDTINKRALSDKQKITRVRINLKLLSRWKKQSSLIGNK